MGSPLNPAPDENVLSIIDTPIPTFNSIPEPTEINDIISDNKPHYKSIKKLNIDLLIIDHYKISYKMEKYIKKLENNEIQMVFGTHAIFQKKIIF